MSQLLIAGQFSVSWQIGIVEKKFEQSEKEAKTAKENLEKVQKSLGDAEKQAASMKEQLKVAEKRVEELENEVKLRDSEGNQTKDECLRQVKEAETKAEKARKEFEEKTQQLLLQVNWIH